MRPKNRILLSLEVLADRVTPATFTFGVVGATFVVTQVDSAVGVIGIDDNSAAGSITLDDIADVNPPMVLSTVGFANLSINLKATDATSVLYDITSPRAGNVTLNVKNTAPRLLGLDGGFMIGGNLTVVGGNGGLSVLEVATPLLVGGNATFKSGSGVDALNLAVIGGTAIGGNLTMNKFNLFGTNAGDTISGSLNFNDAGEANSNLLFLTDVEIGGDLIYVGGARADGILLGGVTPKVGGNVNIKFGSQLALDSSFLLQAAGPLSIIGGNVKVNGGNLGVEGVGLSGEVSGDIRLNLGSGSNTAIVDGDFLGTSFRYNGGAGVDTLSYLPSFLSASAKLNARLGAGADTVTFGGPGAVKPSFASIDFGTGVDTLGGTIDFSCLLINLP